MLWCTNKVIRLTLIAFVLCTCVKLNAQKVDLFGGVGYGSYSHHEMKDYQSYLVNSSGLNASVISEFPSFYTYLFGLNVTLTKWTLGIEAGHGSTGGRVYYEDYSGKLVQDQLIIYNYFGFSPSFIIKNAKKICLTGGVKILIINHTLSIKNSLTVGSQTIYEDQDFNGINLGVQPNVVFRKYFENVFLQASAGYELQSNSYPEMKDEPKLFLDNGSGNPVHLQGNGYRISLCAGIRFGSDK